MSVLDRFEKSVEGAVNGVFSKFGSKDLKPVDLSSALEREIDAEAMPVGRDRTVAPNEYRFKLSTVDFDRIEQWGSEVLANELADNLTQYAKSQHYAFVGPVMVIFAGPRPAQGQLQPELRIRAGQRGPRDHHRPGRGPSDA